MLLNNLGHLREIFETAEVDGARFIGVMVSEDGRKEVVIVMEAFKDKLEYYLENFHVDMTAKNNPLIKILGASFGESFADIERAFI